MNAKEAQMREAFIKTLVGYEMPKELAARATDCWVWLLNNTGPLLDACEKDQGFNQWATYCFMQGFVAGTVETTKAN